MDSKCLEDLWRLLQCPQCLQCPLTPPVFMCASGHHCCSNCSNGFVPISANNTDSKQVGESLCVSCGDKMTSVRNVLCEKLIKMVQTSHNKPNARQQDGVHATPMVERKDSNKSLISDFEDLRGLSREPSREYFSKNVPEGRRNPVRHNLSAAGSLRSSSSESSVNEGRASCHFPIRCPKLPCGRTVAPNGLILHFHYDHKDVSQAAVRRGEEFHVWVMPTAVPPELERCLVLVLIKDPPIYPEPNISPRSLDHPRTRSPFLLMGTRLPCHLNTNMQWHRVASSAEPQNNEVLIDEFFMIWLAGVDIADHSYKMELTDLKDKSKSLTYVGPLMSLKEIMSPREILANGTGLIVSPGVINRLTESSGGIDLNITID